MVDDTLKDAISLVKAGKKVEARKILEPYIMANPHNIQAWLWETETRETITGKIEILEICLQQNPDEPQVKKALAILKAHQKQPVKTDVQSNIPPQVAPRQTLSETSTSSAEYNSSQNIAAKLKPCPYCAEMIQEQAKVCRFCGRDLAVTNMPQQQSLSPENNVPVDIFRWVARNGPGIREVEVRLNGIVTVQYCYEPSCLATIQVFSARLNGGKLQAMASEQSGRPVFK